MLRKAVVAADSECRVQKSGSGGALLGEPDRPFLLIDADDRAARTDRLRDKQRHVTRSGPKVEHVHSRLDAALCDQSMRRPFEAAGL